MTTIAANRECMAADRHFSLDGPSFNSRKLWVHDGSIWSSAGHSGDWFAFQRFVLGIEKDRPVMDREGTFCCLRLSKEGLHYYDYSCVPVHLDDDMFAIGSGQLAALCLMSTGMSPASAIEVVGKFDEGTKGPVDCIWLKDIPQTKKSIKGRAR